MKSSIYLALAIAVGVPAWSAENLPDLGESAQSALSPSQEAELGKRIMAEVHADRAYMEDAEISDYLSNLGNRLVGASADAGRDFEFFLMHDNTLNAFALPGAHIGVHSGLIQAAQNESELAAVLAHEIGHVTQRHIARQIAGENRASLGTLAALAVAILAARSNAQVAEAAIAGAQATAIQSMLDYTREHEREADRVGLQILNRAGFDTRAMPAFFERMQRYNRVYDTNAPQYLRTHPLTSDRIADIQDRADKLPAKAVADSQDFQFVRAKLRATFDPTKDAMRYFDSVRQEKPDDAASAYGMAVTLRRTRDYARAEQELERIRGKQASSPMLENLAAQLKRDRKQTPQALEIYRGALKRFPDSRPLIYGYAETLLDANQPQQALTFLNDRLLLTSSDSHLYELQAQSYAALGKRLLEHRSQAEAYVRKGNLSAAIDQLQIAVRSADGDFYQQSSVEARLRELRAEHEAQKKRAGRASSN